MPVVLVDAVILLTLLEAAALAAYRRRTGAGVAVRDFIVNLGSGLCLMLALRGALAGAGGVVIATWLSAAGLLHAADLALRWSRRGAGDTCRDTAA